MEIRNQMQNHKIQTNSELIYEDGSIWLTLIFIKIIGSDTLWFPLPPTEVLCQVMPYLCIFVEEDVPLLGEMTDKLVLTFICGRN